MKYWYIIIKICRITHIWYILSPMSLDVVVVKVVVDVVAAVDVDVDVDLVLVGSRSELSNWNWHSNYWDMLTMAVWARKLMSIKKSPEFQFVVHFHNKNVLTGQCLTDVEFSDWTMVTVPRAIWRQRHVGLAGISGAKVLITVLINNTSGINPQPLNVWK